jgi:hypothetical protein
MTPLNTIIICKEIDNSSDITESGFETRSTSTFRELEVVASSDERVKEKDIVKVSVNAGQQDNELVIIRVTDIIYIV